MLWAHKGYDRTTGRDAGRHEKCLVRASSKDAKISAVAFNSSAVKKDVIQDFFGKPAGSEWERDRDCEHVTGILGIV